MYSQAAFDRSLNTNESYSRAKQMLGTTGPAIPETSGAQAELEHDVWALLRSDTATLRAIRFVSPEPTSIRLVVEPEHADRLLRLLLPRRLNKQLYGAPGIRATCPNRQDIDLVRGPAKVTIRTGQQAQKLLDALPRGTRWRRQTAVNADEQTATTSAHDAAQASRLLRHLHTHQHNAGNLRAHEASRRFPELAWHRTLAVPAISTHVGLPVKAASDEARFWPLRPDSRSGTAVYLSAGPNHGAPGERAGGTLPWGNIARLMLAWLGGQALIGGQRELHTRDLYAFLAGNGIEDAAHEPARVREQLQALFTTTICMDRPASAADPYEVSRRLMIGWRWSDDGPHHAEFTLSAEFTDQVIRETVHLDPLIVHHLAHDARLLELYQWLARHARTFLEPVTYSWDQMWQRFGERNDKGELPAPAADRADDSRRRMSPPAEHAARFRYAIDHQIRRVLGCMPGCRVTVDADGVRINQLR
ncbi:replication protein RepA [Actinoplanes derwentensis]|uniref:replication protein RepA n=1 Tax=Actinoplanes derwentensis TaxID=113562 RepID=UPI0012FE01AA|nr:replication protein RepA [Actinoplanes derwentensis]GID81985.1 hypothetical protein Ade03nite_09090 [Actinoplanes derwentensis]